MHDIAPFIESIRESLTKTIDISRDKYNIERNWNASVVDIGFYIDSAWIDAEYTLVGGGTISFALDYECIKVIYELRDSFKKAQKPIWGRLRLEIHSDGEFKINWNYDDCDENGCLTLDHEAEMKKDEERRLRLNQEWPADARPSE